MLQFSADSRCDWCTIDDLLWRFKAQDLTPTAVEDVLLTGAKFGFRYLKLQTFISSCAVSADTLDKMLEAWQTAACSSCYEALDCDICSHLHQIAQHAQFSSLSAASRGRLLMLSHNHRTHEMITELVLGSSSTGTSSSSSLEKVAMVQQALKYAVGLDKHVWFSCSTQQHSSCPLRQHRACWCLQWRSSVYGL